MENIIAGSEMAVCKCPVHPSLIHSAFQKRVQFLLHVRVQITTWNRRTSSLLSQWMFVGLLSECSKTLQSRPVNQLSAVAVRVMLTD